MGIAEWFSDLAENYAYITGHLLDASKDRNNFYGMISEKIDKYVKEGISRTKNAEFTKYNNKFTLRTDASNTGLRAVFAARHPRVTGSSLIGTKEASASVNEIWSQ